MSNLKSYKTIKNESKTKRNNSSVIKFKGHTSPFLLLVFAIIIGLTYTTVTAKPNTDIQALQSAIAEKIVRFHVIANSDSDEDQALKLKVKEAVVNYTKPLLENSNSIEESESILDAEAENIKNIALAVIAENGYDYPVTAALTNTYFPTKAYGSYTFPPGMYRAFEIKIGKAQGKNWWCVLYPPLCFIDISHGVVDENSENRLKETLTTEEFNAISGDGEVVFRFKYLKFLNKFVD